VFAASVTAGTWQFTVNDLKNILGQTNLVNPVMWILDNSGNVLQIDDNSGGGYMPRVTRTFPAPANIIVVVGGWTDDRQGSFDFTLQQVGSSAPLISLNDLWFGGWRRTGIRMEVGDRMFVGYPPGYGSAGTPGNVLLAFSSTSTTCSTSCGKYHLGTWDAGTLSQARIPFAAASGSVLVGAWANPALQGTRWFHSKLGGGWGTSSSGLIDGDCDGLTQEIEDLTSPDAALNVATCNLASTSPGSYCDQFKTRLESTSFYSTRDTDNDGLQDDWELYGVRKACSQIPVAPYFSPGVCFDDTFRYTTKFGDICGVSSVSTTFVSSNGLSSLQPNPATYSVLVEEAVPAGQSFSGSASAILHHVYETEGLECDETSSSSCANSSPDFVDLIRQRINTPNPGTLTIPGFWSIATTDFNESMTPIRKFTGTFRYMGVSATTVRGVSAGRTQIITQGTDIGSGYAYAHELGHSLGLGHIGSNYAGLLQSNYVVNYPSIMTYVGSLDDFAGKNPANGDMFPSDYFASCNIDSDCPDSGRCLAGRCMRCGPEFGRLSRGTNSPLQESSAGIVDDSPWPSKFAAEVGCRVVLRDGVTPGGSDWLPREFVGVPAIDWNANGNWANTNYSFAAGGDFNFNGSVDSSTDYDDWRGIYTRGKASLGTNFYGAVRVFAPDFESTAGTDFGIGHASASVSGITIIPPHGAYGQWHSKSFSFDGATSLVSYSGNASIRSAGQQVDSSVGLAGFRFDVFFKVDGTPPRTANMDIVRSSLFALDVSPTGTLTGSLNSTGSLTAVAALSNAVVNDNWYWASIQWNRHDNRFRLVLVKRDSGDWDFTSGLCATTIRSPTVDIDPGVLKIGGELSRPSNRFKGYVDQPTLWNRDQCFHDVDLDEILSGCGSSSLEACP